MCGRVFVQPDLDEILALLGLLGEPIVHDIPASWTTPAWNIAPTEPLLVLRRVDGALRLSLLRWGLIPSWWKQATPPRSTFNARAEGLADAPTFRPSLRARRAVVLVSGIYEWHTDGRTKTAYAIRGEQPLLGLGGLWASWIGPDGPVQSTTIITTAAAPSMAAVHDRMPAVLRPSTWTSFLDPDAPIANLDTWLRPSDAPLTLTPIGAEVGSARNKSGTWMTP